jgi:hypothetical protein
MTISYPRDLPTAHRIESVEFQPFYLQARAPTRGSLMQAADLGPQLWRGSFRTAELTASQADEWQAWLESLEGGIRTFKMWNPVKQYARAYPDGYGALSWDGIGDVVSIAVGLDAITLDGVPAGLVLSAGDMLSYSASSKQRLHRIVEGGTADGSGVVTVGVRPLIGPSPAENAEVLFLKPWCLATVAPNSIRAPWSARRVGGAATVSFEAYQTLV